VVTLEYYRRVVLLELVEYIDRNFDDISDELKETFAQFKTLIELNNEAFGNSLVSVFEKYETSCMEYAGHAEGVFADIVRVLTDASGEGGVIDVVALREELLLKLTEKAAELVDALALKANASDVDTAFAEMKASLTTKADMEWAMPRGAIIMWSGLLANIPVGWALCDGANGTPDLIGKFITGAASPTTDPGETGGTNSLNLTTDNLPAHTHIATEAAHTHTISGTVASAGAHTHTMTPPGSTNGKGDPTGSYAGFQSTSSTSSGGATGSAGAHTHTLSAAATSTTPNITVSDTGSGAAFDNRPAYYALAFLMKL